MLNTMLYIFSHFLHLGLTVQPSGSYPPALDAETERRYFLDMAKGDETAREKLIIHNLRLVSHIVRKYYSASPAQEDLGSIGTIGLIKAVDSFNVEKGAKFATYAARCIQNATLSRMRF